MVMRMRSGLASVGLSGALGLMLMSGQAKATDSFTYNAIPATNNVYSPGATVQYLLYLKETVTGASTSLLAASRENGISGAAVAVVPTVSNAPSTIAGIAANTSDFGTASAYPNTPSAEAPGGVTYGGYLSETQTSTQGTSTGVLEGNTGGGTVISPKVSDSVFLGILSITVGAGTSVFRVGEYDTAGNNTISWNNFYDIDTGGGAPANTFTPVGTNFTTFTISTPEPAGISILGIGAIAGLCRRRRK